MKDEKGARVITTVTLDSALSAYSQSQYRQEAIVLDNRFIAMTDLAYALDIITSDEYNAYISEERKTFQFLDKKFSALETLNS